MLSMWCQPPDTFIDVAPFSAGARGLPKGSSGLPASFFNQTDGRLHRQPDAVVVVMKSMPTTTPAIVIVRFVA